MAQNMRTCANCTLFVANSKAERQAHVENHAVLAIRAQRIFMCPRCGGTACDAVTMATHLRSACMLNAGQVMINLALGFGQHPNPTMGNHPYAYLVTAGGQNAVNQQLVLPIPPQAIAPVPPVQGAVVAQGYNQNPPPAPWAGPYADPEVPTFSVQGYDHRRNHFTGNMLAPHPDQPPTFQATVNVGATPSIQPSHGTAPAIPATQAPIQQAQTVQAPNAQVPAFQAPVPRAPAAQAPVPRAPASQAPIPRAPAFQAPNNGRTPVPRAPAPTAPAPQAPTVHSSSPQASAGNGPTHGGASQPMRSFAMRRSRPSLAARLNGGWARGDRLTAEDFEADKEAASDFDEDEDETATQAHGQLSRIPADVPAGLTHGQCCLLYAYMGVSHSQGCAGMMRASDAPAGEGTPTSPSVEEETETTFGGQPVQQDPAQANQDSDGNQENESMAQSEASADALLDACFHCHEFGHNHHNCPRQQGH